MQKTYKDLSVKERSVKNRAKRYRMASTTGRTEKAKKEKK